MSDIDFSIYRFTEVVGTSKVSWEDAAKNAVELAAKSIRDIRVVEVISLDARVSDQKLVQYRARLKISFKLETNK
jgi:flavin-binding protein dodecin